MFLEKHANCDVHNKKQEDIIDENYQKTQKN